LPPATGPFGVITPPNEASIGGVTMTVHVHLLPYVVQDNLYKMIVKGEVNAAEAPPEKTYSVHDIVVPDFIDSSDSTLTRSGAGITNFAANLRVFSDLGFNTKWDAQISPRAGGLNLKTGEPWYYGTASIPGSFPDGTSNTIAFTTQYSVCGAGGGRNLFFNSAGLATNSPFFGYYPPLSAASDDLNSNAGAGNGVRGEIFQILPAQRDCNPSYTPQGKALGLPVCLSDGSARRISPSISIRTWGLLVQPNDGLPLPEDWDR
jgi:hypothetical protein